MSGLKTSFSRLNPGSRGQATIISNPSDPIQKDSEQRTTRVTSFLPLASPSFVSGRLDHQRHHWNRPRTWAKPTPGSLQINLLFTIFAEQAQTRIASCKLIFLQKTKAGQPSTGSPIQDASPSPIVRRPVRSAAAKAATASGQ